MSEIISSEDAAEPARRPKPQPFPQSIPQPRQSAPPQRASSIYDESAPVVRDEADDDGPTAPAVTGNSPQRRPAENPFPNAEQKRVAAPSETASAAGAPQRRRQTPAETASSTLKAAEQLRAAAGEKARQLREVAEAQSKAARSEVSAKARSAASAAEVIENIPEALSGSAPAAVPDPPAPEPSRNPAPQRTPEPAPAPAPAPARAKAPQPAPGPTGPATAPAPAPDPAPQLSQSAQDKVAEWKAVAEATWADASVVLKDIQKESERYIRANPTRAALTALGVGFVLGVILKR